MDWYDQPAQAPPPVRTVTGIRRGIVTAALAVGLLGVGGVAVVLAASPDPSAAAPNATTQPSTNGGSPSGSAAPRHKGNCPNMGSGSGTNGSNSSPNGSSGVSGSDA